MTDRKGDWLQSYTGRQLWPLDMRPEDVAIEDVAHHLAIEPRFLGATRVPYSVGEHSVRVCDYVIDQMLGRAYPAILPAVARLALTTPAIARLGLRALLHDGSEYVLRDLPRPTKTQPEIAVYKVWEAGATRAILTRFDLDEEEPEIVKEADARLLVTEKRDLLGPAPAPWTIAQGRDSVPLPERIEPWDWRTAERLFLERFHQLDAIRRS